jgi:hypothetical protein
MTANHIAIKNDTKNNAKYWLGFIFIFMQIKRGFLMRTTVINENSNLVEPSNDTVIDLGQKNDTFPPLCNVEIIKTGAGVTAGILMVTFAVVGGIAIGVINIQVSPQHNPALMLFVLIYCILCN